MIYSFTVNVNQAIKFYDILGGDKELLGDKKEFEEINENNNNKNKEINNEVVEDEKDPIVEKVIKERKSKRKVYY